MVMSTMKVALKSTLHKNWHDKLLNRSTSIFLNIGKNSLDQLLEKLFSCHPSRAGTGSCRVQTYAAVIGQNILVCEMGGLWMGTVVLYTIEYGAKILVITQVSPSDHNSLDLEMYPAFWFQLSVLKALALLNETKSLSTKILIGLQDNSWVWVFLRSLDG